ncbi:hypothetical protein [Novipirellula maiorica]|uniref:hypothetical protein n=1 Tax=Novipirellula maiorica TaxID=1265734 RepID=UPI001181913C|nr:hypothetical protein [Rhodopirellula maiorica]
MSIFAGNSKCRSANARLKDRQKYGGQKDVETDNAGHEEEAFMRPSFSNLPSFNLFSLFRYHAFRLDVTALHCVALMRISVVPIGLGKVLPV